MTSLLHFTVVAIYPHSQYFLALSCYTDFSLLCGIIVFLFALPYPVGSIPHLFCLALLVNPLPFLSIILLEFSFHPTAVTAHPSNLSVPSHISPHSPVYYPKILTSRSSLRTPSTVTLRTQTIGAVVHPL